MRRSLSSAALSGNGHGGRDPTCRRGLPPGRLLPSAIGEGGVMDPGATQTRRVARDRLSPHKTSMSSPPETPRRLRRQAPSA